MKLTIRESDKLFGELNEDYVIGYYFGKFNIKLNKLDEYHLMDYEDVEKTQYIEIKSRFCKSTTYPTTMIGLNKIMFAKDCGKKVRFIFCFIDKMMYYDYNPKDSFVATIAGRKDRGVVEMKKYVFIPIEKLKVFDP